MIRPYQKQDKELLTGIFKKNTPVFFAKEELKEFEDYLDKFPETYYVIELEHTLAGGVGCEFRKSDKSGRINWIFIHPDFKENGLGKEAVEFCFNEFQKNENIEKLIVRTSQHAWKSFSKFGYRLAETKKDYWAKGIDLYLMEMSVQDLHSVKTWGRVANQYKDKFNALDLYKQGYDALLQLIPEHAEILDVACGPATIAQYLIRKRPDLKIEACDYSEEMISVAKEIIPEALFHVIDCRDILQIEKKFNVVVCGFCLPYLTIAETEKFISDASELLVKGGLMYLSFIEGLPEDSHLQKSSDGKNQLFVNYYTTEMVSDILAGNHFSINHIFHCSYQTAAKSDRHTLIISTKN